MPKFKEGDRVRLVRSVSNPGRIGAVGIIKFPDFKGQWVGVYMDGDKEYLSTYPEDWFELVEEEKTMEYNVGDIVHIRMKVTSKATDEVYTAEPIRDNGELAGSSIFFGITIQPVFVEPRPLKVGDRVETPSGAFATIIAIDEDMAWVKYAGGSRNGVFLSNLKRID